MQLHKDFLILNTARIWVRIEKLQTDKCFGNNVLYLPIDWWIRHLKQETNFSHLT